MEGVQSKMTAPTDLPGKLVMLGLGDPKTRAAVAFVSVGALTYITGFPRACWDEDGRQRPLKWFTPGPDSTSIHFLMLPVAAAVIAGVLL